MKVPSCPITLRSAGVVARAVAAPVARGTAWARFERVSPIRGLVSIEYLGARDLLSIFRVDVRQPPSARIDGLDPLYEEAYRLACAAVAIHGFEIDRFATV